MGNVCNPSDRPRYPRAECCQERWSPVKSSKSDRVRVEDRDEEDKQILAENHSIEAQRDHVDERIAVIIVIDEGPANMRQAKQRPDYNRNELWPLPDRCVMERASQDHHVHSLFAAKETEEFVKVEHRGQLPEDKLRDAWIQQVLLLRLLICQELLRLGG